MNPKPAKVMKRLLLLTAIVLGSASTIMADTPLKATIHADKPGAKINREIYGQFSEHLGSCILSKMHFNFPFTINMITIA